MLQDWDWDWAYGGINASVPRNVGPECSDYLSIERKIWETLFLSIFIAAFLVYGYRSVKVPAIRVRQNQDRLGKRIVLLVMALVFGIEVGLKFSSRTVIYFLNPCHVTTAIQLYLLVAEPSPTVTALFRIQLNLLNGPLLAFLFPETESRKILIDQAMYYIQHGLMVVIPYYLLRIGGVYNVEPLWDISWNVLAYGLNTGYHFWVLQPIAMPAQVNLSHILCPAILDPFEGQNYRLWVFLHQGLLCPLLCKLLCYTSNYFITKCPLTRVKSSLEMPLPARTWGKIMESENSSTLADVKNGRKRCD